MSVSEFPSSGVSGETVQFPVFSQLCDEDSSGADGSPAEKKRKLVSLPLLETTGDSVFSSAESLDPVEDSVLGALNKVIGIKNHNMQCSLRGLGDPKQFDADTWKVLGPTRFDKFREDPIEEFSLNAPDPDSDDAPAIATGPVAAGEGNGVTHLTSSKVGADSAPPFSVAVGAPVELQVSGTAMQVSGSWDACSGALTIVVQYPPSDSLDGAQFYSRGASGQAGHVLHE